MNTQPLPIPTLESSDDNKAPKRELAQAVKQTPRLAKLTNELAKLYATIGLFTTRFDTYDGLILIRESHHRATEVVNVAKHHKRMLEALEAIVDSNDYVACFIGHGMMAYAILAHHGKLKSDPLFLAQFGYHEQQVMAPPEGVNGSPTEKQPAKEYATS